MANKFAAYNDQAIWGTGNTPAEAVADAKQYVNAEDAENFDLDTAPMTKALAAKVERIGGNLPFNEFNGTLMTCAAWDRVASK
jgi:hypothetical protein